jgi:large subunit ribosomal protein L29
MKSHEMREMTLEELELHLDAIAEELANLKIKLAIKQLDNPLRVRGLKREIARAKTVLREKTLGAMPGQTLDQAANAAGEKA